MVVMKLRSFALGVLMFLPTVLGPCNGLDSQPPVIEDPFVKQSETTLESRKPLTVNAARRYTRFKFPDSAENIEFYHYQEWIAVNVYVRFEATVEDCIATAEEMIRSHNRENRDRKIQDLAPIVKDDSPANGDIQVMPSSDPAWFRPVEIKNGQFAGPAERFANHCPNIWIDTENGVFYYEYSD
jgi:hypothetical protein